MNRIYNGPSRKDTLARASDMPYFEHLGTVAKKPNQTLNINNQTINLWSTYSRYSCLFHWTMLLSSVALILSIRQHLLWRHSPAKVEELEEPIGKYRSNWNISDIAGGVQLRTCGRKLTTQTSYLGLQRISVLLIKRAGDFWGKVLPTQPGQLGS